MNTITGSFIFALEFSTVTTNRADEWFDNVSAKLPAEEAVLVRRAQATLLGNIVVAKPWAPRRGIVPSMATYHGVWSWDAAFHAAGVSHWDAKLAREQVEIILSGQQPNGMLPDLLQENGGVEARVTKPPVMAWAVAVVDRRAPDDAWLRAVYPKLVKNTEF
jgi:putative isomerase